MNQSLHHESELNGSVITDADPFESTRVVSNLEPFIRNPKNDFPEIPGHEIVQRIGHGGMSQVFLASQKGVDRLVAIKIIHPELSQQEHVRRRFLREAMSIAKLRHPNIVEICQIGEVGGRLYICLEYVAGDTLAALVRRERPNPRTAAMIVRQLASAVQSAHDRNIIHRDLKPANVLCVLASDNDFNVKGTPPVVKVTDFGLARIVSEVSEETRSGLPIGTPSYMSPEQASGKLADIGVASDVYGLGAILYELLSGRPPFRCETMTETIQEVLHNLPTPPRQLAKGIPPDLELICLQCLEKEPGLRYSSAAALGDDLQRFLDGRSIAARPHGMLHRWLARLRQRLRPSFATVGAAMLAVTAAIVFWHWQKAEQSRDSALPSRERVPEPRDAKERGNNAVEQLLLRIRENPQNPEPARLVAEMEEEKRLDLIQRHPHDFAVCMTAGDAYLTHLKQPEKAGPLYQEARRIAGEQTRQDATDLAAWNHLAWAHERLGDYELAKKNGANAMGEYERAITTREQLLQDGSDREQALEIARLCGKQGELYLEGKDPRTALLLYARRLSLLVESLPNLPELKPEIRATHLRLAEISRQVGNAQGVSFHEKAAAELEMR